MGFENVKSSQTISNFSKVFRSAEWMIRSRLIRERVEHYNSKGTEILIHYIHI